MSKLVRTVLVVAAVVGVGTSVAWAAGLMGSGFVASDGSITACVDDASGNVRFIDPTSANKNLNACKKNESQVALASPPGPAAVTVDCSAGQTIGQALKQTMAAPSVDISVKGTCDEAVKFGRDNVTLEAASSGAGIDSQTGDAALDVVGAHDVSVQGLTLTGGFEAGGSGVTLNGVTITACQAGNGALAGIAAAYGASVTVFGGSITGCQGVGVVASVNGSVLMFNATVTGAGFTDVSATFGGAVEIHDSTISNAGHFDVRADGGSIVLYDTQVTGAGQSGVDADEGGTVSFASGTEVSGNQQAGVSAQGGHLEIADATIDNNDGSGVALAGGSSLTMDGATVTGNHGDGVDLKDTSVAAFDGSPNQITGNGGWGIFCEPSPSVAMIEGSPGTVTGNTAGQNDCPSA